VCRDEVDQTISSIDAQEKLVLLPTRDTNCDRRKKECKRTKATETKMNATPVDAKTDLPPRYLKTANHSSSCNVLY